MKVEIIYLESRNTLSWKSLLSVYLCTKNYSALMSTRKIYLVLKGFCSNGETGKKLLFLMFKPLPRHHHLHSSWGKGNSLDQSYIFTFLCGDIFICLDKDRLSEPSVGFVKSFSKGNFVCFAKCLPFSTFTLPKLVWLKTF